MRKESGNIKLRAFRDEDFEKLIALLKTTYEEKEILSKSYLGWEYVLNPDGEALISVAESDERLVSEYIVLPRNYIIGGKKYKGSLSVNTLTDPAFRGKGLFPKLAEDVFYKCKQASISFTIGIPNRNSYPGFIRKLNFAHLGKLPLMVKTKFSIHTLLHGLRIKKPEAEAPIFFGKSEIRLGEYSVSKINFIADKKIYNEFLRQFHRIKENATERSLAYLHWRYQNVPHRHYLLLKVCKNQTMIGYVVLRFKNVFGLKCGIIVDICSALKDEQAWKIALYVTDYLSSANKADLIFSTVPKESDEAELLKKNGFHNVPEFLMPRNLPLIFRSHVNDISKEAHDFKKWFFTFGDYDVF